MKVEVETLQTDINCTNIDWDSTKLTETPYLHCGPSGHNKNERKK